MSNSNMRLFILFMFYLSVATCFFLSSKWATQNTVKQPDHPWKRIDVIITLLLATPVLFFVQLFPGKQTITSCITKFHAVGDKFVMTGFIFVCETLAHRYLMNDPERIEGWIACWGFLAVLLYFVLHATSDVSGYVCRLLAYQLFSLVVIDVIVGDYVSAVVSGVTGFVCWMVMVTGFGGGDAEVSV